MQHGYSPYRQQRSQKSHRSPFRFKIPKIKLPKNLPKNLPMWLSVAGGVLFGFFLLIYLSLGELRFFANHYFGLGFFSKNYLVLFQNNYELRPSGGFITGFGKVNVFMGFPGEIQFKNSYEVDTQKYITPPYPHEELLKNENYEGYTFRDANWDPDFPSSAKQLTKFYEEKYPDEAIDGLIVMNFSLIEELSEKLGGIKLNDKIYTKDNLFSALQFEVNNVDRHSVEALKNRKNILGELAGQLIGKMKRHPFKSRDAITQALHEKELFIWLKNNRLQKKLEKRGWSNDLSTEKNSDFLSVNLANLGSKKSDRYLQSEIHYFADLSNEVPKITTEVTLRHPGSINTHSDHYKGYLRLYIPKNAETTSLPLDTKVNSENNLKVLGTKITLPPGGKTSITYQYNLPRNLMVGGQYQLKIGTQSGTSPLYHLHIDAKSDQTLKSDQFITKENKANFIGILKGDQKFQLNIIEDQIPAYPIEQQFIALDEIEIIWNESINQSEAKNSANYQITDLDHKNKITDSIEIGSIHLPSENVVQLKLLGVTKQDLEAYQIKINNIKDTSGNLIIPNPKIITAIQRIKPKEDAPEIKLGEVTDLPETEAEISD